MELVSYFNLRNSPIEGLEEVSARVAEDKRRYVDLDVSSQNIKVLNKFQLDAPVLEIKVNGFDKEVVLSPLGYSQLCAKLSIPYSFVSKNPPDIQTEVLSYWINNFPHDYLRFRCINIEDVIVLRAVLGPRYAIIDDADVLNSIRFMLSNRQYVDKVDYIGRDDYMMEVRILTSINFEAGGELWKVGVVFSNSEVGYARLKNELLIFRQICSNGMIAKWGRLGYYRKHIGDNSRILYDFSYFLEKWHDLLMDDFNTDSVAKIRRSIENSMKKNVSRETLKDLSLKLGKGFVIDCIKQLAPEFEGKDFDDVPPISEFDFVDKMTRKSQLLPPKDRYEIDRLAGKVLALAA